MDIAMLFLMLASEIMRVCKWFSNDKITMTKWELGENSAFKGSKEGNTSLNLLSILMMDSLMILLWQQIRELRKIKCCLISSKDCDFRRDCKIWLWGSECAYNWVWQLSLQRWRLMGMRPAMALILNKGEVQNMLRIQMAAFFYIRLRTLREYNSRALL